MRTTRRRFLQASALGAAGAMGMGRGRPGAAPAAAQSGTLTVWGFEGTLEGLKSQVDAFKQKYPDVDVDIKEFGYDDVHTNLLNAIVAGSGAPDLCAIDVLRLTQYVDGLADLSAHRAEYENAFVPPILDLCSYQGKLYGLATDSEPIGILYRKDIWDQYGIGEDAIQIWSDLAEAGNKVDQDSGGKVKLYAISGNEFHLFDILGPEQGFAGYFFDETDTKVIVDDPKCIEAAGVIKQLWDSKGASHNPNKGIYDAEMTVLLKSGRVASQIVGPAWFPLTLTQEMPELAGKWRLMRAPAITAGGPRVGYQYPTVFVIPSQSDKQDLAWEFEIMGLTGAGARTLFEQTHILPADAGLLAELQAQPDDYFGGQQIYALWEEIARDTPKVFFGTGFTEAQQILGNHLQDIVSGKKSPEDGMREAAEEMRSKLKKG
jgi:lactose/L-arabinose transport system substrate-binding protein